MKIVMISIDVPNNYCFKRTTLKISIFQNFLFLLVYCQVTQLIYQYAYSHYFEQYSKYV